MELLPRCGLRKDGTLGYEESGKPIAFGVVSVADAKVKEFLWSDDTVGPLDAILLPARIPALTWREPLILARLMLAGLTVAIVGLAAVPLSWVFPSFRSKSNCLIHSATKMSREGGFVIFMPSEHGWWTHAVHSPDLKLYEEYHPLLTPAMVRRLALERVGRRRPRRPPMLFEGVAQPWIQKTPTDK